MAYYYFLFYVFLNDFVNCQNYQRYPKMMEDDEMRQSAGLKRLKKHRDDGNYGAPEIKKPSDWYDKHKGHSALDYGDYENAIKHIRQKDAARYQQPKYADYGPLDVNDMFKKLTEYGKWDEFYERYNKDIDSLNGGKTMKNWEQNANEWKRWLRQITEENAVKRVQEPRHFPETPKEYVIDRRQRPSLGMEMYWGEEEKQKSYKRERMPSPVERDLQYMPPEQAKAIALQKLYQIQASQQQALRNQQPAQSQINVIMEQQRALRDKLTKNVPMIQPPPSSQIQQLPLQDLIQNNLGLNEQGMPTRPFPQSQNNNPLLANTPIERAITVPPRLNATTKTVPKIKEVIPLVDDLGSPIRWVNYNSPETDDGLAKVTDKVTGRNKQFIINGTMFVPIIDNNPERFSLTTVGPTTPFTPTNKNESVLRTVLTNVDFKKASTTDWLAYSIVMGEKNYDKGCDYDGCHARCFSAGCESRCTGDTCMVGCVGEACSAACSGPGCKAMCIGARCATQCDGMNCESKCRGNECDARCKKLSCTYSVNDVSRQGGGTWKELYPQYDTRAQPSYDY